MQPKMHISQLAVDYWWTYEHVTVQQLPAGAELKAADDAELVDGKPDGTISSAASGR